MDDEWKALCQQMKLPVSFGPAPVEAKTKMNAKVGERERKTEAKVEESEALGLSVSSEFPILPVSLSLKAHKKAVSCLAMEANGARMVTGSYDSSLAYWDWATLKGGEPFRLVEGMEGNPLRTVRWSPDGQLVLCAGSMVKGRLFDRHGSLVHECPVGDRYLLDLRRTEGHVAALTGAQWLPKQSDRFLTSSLDGTVRLWSAAQAKKQERVILVKSRVPVWQAQPTEHGTLLTLSGDGLLRMMPLEGSTTKLEEVKAHEAGTVATALVPRPGCAWQWASRATDGTVQLWDTRALKEPLAKASALPCLHEETGLAWSPDGARLVTGTTTAERGQRGELVCLESDDLACSHRLSLASPAIALEWHVSLNQLAIGHADGICSVLYHPTESSRKGALLADLSPRNKATLDSILPSGPIINPDAIPYHQAIGDDERGGKYRDRRNPLTSKRPDLPLSGPGRGGRIGATTITQSIMKRVLPDRSRNEDPREALLKYAKLAEEDPRFITPAYRETQPLAILDPQLLVKEVEEKAAKEAARQKQNLKKK